VRTNRAVMRTGGAQDGARSTGVGTAAGVAGHASWIWSASAVACARAAPSR
jgi:hypothetical protein